LRYADSFERVLRRPVWPNMTLVELSILTMSGSGQNALFSEFNGSARPVRYQGNVAPTRIHGGEEFYAMARRYP
jgi:hypothetical protein